MVAVPQGVETRRHGGLDPLNPQTAARMSTAFETWARHDAGRQAQAKAQLDRILAAPGLSRDLGEMAARLRGG